MEAVNGIKRIIEKALLGYSLYLPYHPGKWRVVEALVKLFGLLDLDAETAVTVRRQGVRWKLRKRCLVQRALYYFGVYEIHETRWLLKTLSPDWCVFDVGANFGYYSLLIAGRTHDKAQVYSFEPNPASMALLEDNRALNQFAGVHPQALALSDQAGTVELLVPAGGNEGLGHLRSADTPDNPRETAVEVETLTMDAFVERENISRLDFVKMDVEGAEALVLSGAEKSLRRFRPLMLIEINPEALAGFGVSADWLLEKIRSLGYQAHRIHKGTLVPLHRADEISDYVNAICLPV